MDALPDLGRLRLLVELSRLGTMAAVAERTGYGTSAVSKHLAVLEQEIGAPLLAPVGRRVRLTPAGERLVEHAIGILAAVEEARAELCGEAGPAGRMRLAGYASATEQVVVPALVRLRTEHPGVEAQLYEHEPEQTLQLLLAGDIDLGVIYDYSLVPREVPSGLSVRHLAAEPLHLALPAAYGTGEGPAALPDLRQLAGAGWITNSRGTDDDELVQRVCALAGFTPRIAHRVDSLHLINMLAGAGLGVALLADSGVERHRTDVVFRPLDPLLGTRRSFLVARRGQWSWPPIACAARALAEAAQN
ncbi:LysR family transcriptional regulator [Actinacidiphila oryziradicis]|uniref:LysR family transcriptional regulator n=1 Tax=Actinacidiphila oryziradicis TaxID=2571141 RepID=UPI0023F247E6|nr:LysR family transcriptional regulator [Actinacidiphila oryziradicis]MCW2871039.1 LysR family transcriptional regulator [Actinacidiphila oryziradicis]